MFNKKSLFKCLSFCVISVGVLSGSFGQVSTFEDLSSVLGSSLHWDGSGQAVEGSFSSGGAQFTSVYETAYGGYWSSGWAYSNVVNTTSAGANNLYGTYPGKGADNSATYAVGQQDAVIKFTGAVTVSGLQIANSTYAALVIKNGNGFSKPFGGTSGTDPDYFKLTVYGYQNGILNTLTGVTVYLADYRSSISGEDFILDTWESVDLSTLGKVDSLKFKLASSDTGDYGINTPLFFDIDNISISGANIIDFENEDLSPNSYWNKAEQDNATGFSDGSAYFQTNYTTSSYGDYWSQGFVYSEVNNTTLAGYSNQYAAITGSGYDNSKVYAVTYGISSISLQNPATVSGFYATNATYTYLSMKNGDSFAKKFGGNTGNDPDYLKLIVKGFEKEIQKSDTAIFYLADYRNADNTKDYSVNDWRWVDLSSLGTVDSLVFSFQSTDVGVYGINTPLYFAMDNFSLADKIQTSTTAELENNKTLSLYPNPASDLLTINLTNNSTGMKHINVVNTSGNVVLQKDFSDASLKIDVSALPVGIYFVNVQDANSNIFAKFIKQ